MNSYYNKTFMEMKKLEQEFVSLDGGHNAHRAWIICNVTGIFLAMLGTIFIVFRLFDQSILVISDFILLVAVFLGVFIVWSATREYQNKYNSWLRITKNIERV